MADKEVATLPAADALTGAETFHVVQSSNSRKATAAQMATLAIAGAALKNTAAFDAEVAVASATTADVLGAASLFVRVTGTATITSFGTGIDRLRVVRFTGVLTLTHNATSLILPGGANIVTAAGDVAILESDASSNVRVVSYMRASGKALIPPAFSEVTGKTLVEMWSFLFEAPEDGDYDVIVNCPYACTVNSITTDAAAGTSTLTGKINTTALGGTANSVSTSEQEQVHSSANEMVAGDNLRLTFASVSGAEKVTVTVKVTRTL